jgi:hypothetical protein
VPSSPVPFNATVSCPQLGCFIMKHPVLPRAEFPSLRCANVATPQLTLRYYSCSHSCVLIWGAQFPVTSSRLRPVSCLYDVLHYPIYPISCLGFSPLFLLALIFWCHSVPYQNTPYYTTPPSTTTDRTTLRHTAACHTTPGHASPCYSTPHNTNYYVALATAPYGVQPSPRGFWSQSEGANAVNHSAPIDFSVLF